jgi:SAM-dependent methyltransferase
VVETAFPDCYFDLITMYHSLEHVRDPFATLRTVRRLLSPSGQVIVATPNLSSWLAQMSRRWYWQLDSPRHLYVFGPRSLARMAAMAGLQLDFRYTRTEARGIGFSFLYFLSDVLEWPRDRFLLGRDSGRVSHWFRNSFVGNALDLLCLLVDLCTRGDTLFVHLSQPDHSLSPKQEVSGTA